MAGHSHWSKIKRQKGVADARRGRLFSKLARQIITAAKAGGGDPDGNLRLRCAIDAAKAEGLPKDTIERAIQKGAGGGEGENWETVVYEGYGPGGVAVLVEALTDNRHRTAPEVRRIFEKCGGNLGESGCVGFLFQRKAVLVVRGDTLNEDRAVEIALEAGADDVRAEGSPGTFEITAEPDRLRALRDAFVAAGQTVVSAALAPIPMTTVRIEDVRPAQRLLDLMSELDEHDDVQHAWANFDIPEDVLEAAAAAQK